MVNQGDTFTTKQFTEAVYQAYQGSDRDEVVASAPNQSKVKHVARWAQQKAKAQGYIVRGQERGQWVVNWSHQLVTHKEGICSSFLYAYSGLTEWQLYVIIDVIVIML